MNVGTKALLTYFLHGQSSRIDFSDGGSLDGCWRVEWSAMQSINAIMDHKVVASE